MDPCKREEFVFHIYVDPLFGDNRLATDFNPCNFGTVDPRLNGSNLVPLAKHPNAGDPTRRISGYLQHAPYSFKTLSSPPGGSGIGALEYAEALFPGLPASFPSPEPGEGRSVTRVLIHCLPGLYGPVGDGLPRIDLRSGIPYNGESFPVEFTRDRISVQGTSALDTVFDARGQQVAIFDISGDAASQASQANVHQELFFDSISVRGARGGEEASIPAGAGFYINGRASSWVIVSNCFIFDNTVGVAVDGSSEDNGNPAPHRCHFVNNTIAWNTIGVWQGDNGPQGLSSPHSHATAHVNNIYDPASPPGFPVAYSCFEGVRNVDMEVWHRGPTPPPPPPLGINRNFCAWVPALADRKGLPPYPASAAPWTAPSTSIGTDPAPSSPRVDLTPFASQPRTLYVADSLRNAPLLGGVDYSPHDLRLCPTVSPDDEPPSAGGAPSNPLVNMGIDGGPLQEDILLKNGRIILGQGPGWPSVPGPGCEPVTAETATITAWDWDTEGAGNPRIATPAGYADGDFGEIDIGADEADRLIVAGFHENTRIFAPASIPNSTALSHNRVFFFSHASTTEPTRPEANTYLGRGFTWYQHIQNPTDTFPWPPSGTTPSNYTWGTPQTAVPGTLRWWQVLQAQRRPFMRNLECDFSPHPLMDAHPFWPQFLAQLNSVTYPGIDHYASNPWYMNVPGNMPPGQHLSDNPALYHNLFHATNHNNTDYPVQPYGFTAVLHAGMNPPGTFTPASSWIVPPSAQFGPFGSCTGSSLQFGDWSFNELPAGCPDTLPFVAGEEGQGRRYNLEFGPSESNLQTFLAIQPVGLDPIDPQQAGIPEGAEQFREQLRAVERLLRGSR